MRLDAFLVAEGLSASRERAKAAVQSGSVRINGKRATKPSQTVFPDDRVTTEGDTHHYVSRGALKLVAALDHFGLSAEGVTALDLGASTGGFTQVLLERGAARVFAVDVGTDQLAPAVRSDPRVVNLEKTHGNQLSVRVIPETVTLIVADVSFISLRKVLPYALALAAAQAAVIALIKPQFELGPTYIGKRGLVTLPLDDVRAWATETFPAWFSAQPGNWQTLGIIDSPITGGDGNHEFLIAVRKATPGSG